LVRNREATATEARSTLHPRRLTNTIHATTPIKSRGSIETSGSLKNGTSAWTNEKIPKMPPAMTPTSRPFERAAQDGRHVHDGRVACEVGHRYEAELSGAEKDRDPTQDSGHHDLPNAQPEHRAALLATRTRRHARSFSSPPHTRPD
jgi:hypothetical protein